MSKSKDNKGRIYPDREYLERGLREGWIKVATIAMKMILVDSRFQARRTTIDMDHVKKLADIRNLNDGEYLHPIVVFVLEDGRFLLADGFHRHRENANRRNDRRSEAIPAYVVTVKDVEHQATMFATMCNQELSLRRSDEDKRKAVEMICTLPACAKWSEVEIGAHCGVHPRTAKKWRLEWAARERRNIPPRIKPARPEFLAGAAPRIVSPGDEESPIPETPPPLSSPRALRSWLLEQGVLSESKGQHVAWLHISAFQAGRRSVVICSETDTDSLYAAFGRAIAFQKTCAPDAIPAVVIEKFNPHIKIYQALEKCGVEILSPRELIEKFRSEDGKDTHQEGADDAA
jgi:hypothetical protein